MGSQARITVEVRVRDPDMEALRGLALNFVIVDDGAPTCGDLGHGVCEIDGLIGTDERLHEAQLRALAGNDEISRVARPRFTVSRSDKEEVNGVLTYKSTRHLDIGAIAEESCI